MSSSLSIMLVDDNEFDLYLYEKFIQIKKISNQIIKFLSAREALDYLELNKNSTWPDVIILDIHMPVMDGFNFLNFYENFELEKRNSTQIIMVSSTLDSGDNEKVLQNPLVLALLNKPLNMDELIIILKRKGLLSEGF
jgi:CRISPR-associated protein Cas8b1/Cst1 subtype I-B